MVSLIDIGPLTEEVPYRGHKINVQGVTAMEIMVFLQNYPQLRRLAADKALSPGDIEALVASIPMLLAEVIAAGCGKFGDAPTIEAALRMTPGEGMLFLQPIMRLTFPQGVKSFVEGLNGFLQSAEGPGWGQATRSPGPSRSASPQDTDRTAPGDTPPEGSPPGATSSDGTTQPGGSRISTISV